MTSLLDTGFLLALLDEDDKLHDACKQALLTQSKPLLPEVVLPELAYMVLRELGYPPLIQFMNAVNDGELELIKMTASDLKRTTEILSQYADSKIDFVDCAIAAIAERLNIQTILTVDQRHFQLFRPQHCSFFTLLPQR